MSRHRRDKCSIHFHQHCHQHHHQSHTQSVSIKQSHPPPPVRLVPTMQTLVNAPVRINAMTRHQTFAPSLTSMPAPPAVQQHAEDSLAAFVTGVLSAFVVAASLLSSHGGPKSRR
jgi:hypothetical protein